MRPLLLLSLAASLLLAGCTGGDAPSDGGDDPAAGGDAIRALTNEEAARLLTSSVEEMPEAFAVEMALQQGGATVATIEGSFDNATGTSYIEIRGDADALANLSGELGEASAFLAHGFAIYSTPEGSLYLANGTAFVFPPEEGDDDHDRRDGAFGSPEEGPFGALLGGDELVAEALGENVTVTSVAPTTHRGEAAVRIDATVAEGNATSDMSAIVFLEPRRLARMEADLPADPDEEGAANPFGDGRVVAEFYYDDEARAAVPDSARRSLALAYDSDAEPFSFEPSMNVTWTFRASGGVALDEVEAQVKARDGDVSGGDLAALPTAWSMRLSEGTRTEGSVTMTFTDADGDGLVSAGDTLRVETTDEDEGLPTVMLYDLETGTYVVPGPGALLGLAALAGAAALGLRARRPRA